MKHRIAAFCALFAIFLLLLPLFTNNAYAAGINDLPSYEQAIQKGDSGLLNKEFYDLHTTVNPMWGMGELIVGCTSCPPTSSLHYSKSALAGIGNYMAAMYTNPPANTYAFVRDMGQSLGFVPRQVNAQGVGFSGLAPLLGLWKAFRNIAYTLLALVMIVIGFMVMFRRKIDPKTVVTIQNALPRIVITLLLITFSYAIVGLLIDLMYLVILLALAVIGSSGIQGVNTAQLQTSYVSGGLGQLISGVFSPLSVFGLGGAAGAVGIAPLPIAGVLSMFLPGIGVGIAALIAAISYGVGAAGSLLSGQSLGLAVLSPLLFFVFAIGLLFAVIRIFLMLLGAYMQIILALILGPIQILLDAVPGANGFGAWMTNLLSNLMVFPITIILLAIAGVISQNLSAASSLWIPPLLPGGTADIIRAIIGIGIVLQIPNIVNGLKKSLKVQAPIPVGVGGAFAPIVGGIQMFGGHLLQTSLLAKRLRDEEDRKTRNAPPAAPSGGGHTS